VFGAARFRTAVPELTRIVAAPFDPVRIGTDSDDVIAEKLYDIELRSMVIDALVSIGPAASPSTKAVIRWALTVRAISDNRATREEEERFIDLVTLDAEYRQRIIAVTGKLGEGGLAIVAQYLKSSDPEERKFAGAILGSTLRISRVS
jgi:hypothetical protein